MELNTQSNSTMKPYLESEKTGTPVPQKSEESKAIQIADEYMPNIFRGQASKPVLSNTTMRKVEQGDNYRPVVSDDIVESAHAVPMISGYDALTRGHQLERSVREAGKPAIWTPEQKKIMGEMGIDLIL
jgi:hypothetical protein